jgi:hypothetical protein
VVVWSDGGGKIVVVVVVEMPKEKNTQEQYSDQTGDQMST